MRTARRVWLAAVAIVLPLSTPAANLSFLKRTPLYYFTENEMQMMYDAAISVLNDADSRTTREWTNPKNQYSGTVEGLGHYRSTDGLHCRRLRISNQARGIQSSSIFPVCKAGTGQWTLASGKQLESLDGR